jgi:hypothetical protein
MKAEWKRSKCSAASSHPNKAIQTIFSLVAEYFLQPPRTLYACYTPLSTLNSDFQCQEYFINGYTAVHKRNEATDILKWHQAEFNSIILLWSVPTGMEASEACPLLLFALVAFWYIIALFNDKFEFKGAPYAFKMSSLSTRCKVAE